MIWKWAQSLENLRDWRSLENGGSCGGSDFLLICNDPISIYEGYNAVLEAVKSGEITETRIEESINRIETSRKKLTQPLEFSLKRIAELSREIVELKESLK